MYLREFAVKTVSAEGKGEIEKNDMREPDGDLLSLLPAQFLVFRLLCCDVCWNAGNRSRLFIVVLQTVVSQHVEEKQIGENCRFIHPNRNCSAGSVPVRS